LGGTRTHNQPRKLSGLLYDIRFNASIASRGFFLRFKANSIRRARGIGHEASSNDLDIAETMRGVIAAATMFGKPPRQIFGGADIVPASGTA